MDDPPTIHINPDGGLDLTKIIENRELRDKFFVFKNRKEAGEVLVRMLKDYQDSDAIILGIPAGGVPVAAVIAKKLNLTLDVLIVSKITLPWNREAGYGAVAFNGTIKLNQKLIDSLGLTGREVEAGIKETLKKVERRVQIFRKGKPPLKLKNRTVIVVDDGLASGYTMLAAVEALRRAGAGKIIIAVPTANLDAIKRLEGKVDMVYSPNIRHVYPYAVADAYKNWYDISEDEVKSILQKF
ncbi:MAG: phosphoribosyltransferase [Methanobacteriales archaeon]|nr:phosphoribosyltransferase [Methanobacteriales archaeon]